MGQFSKHTLPQMTIQWLLYASDLKILLMQGHDLIHQILLFLDEFGKSCYNCGDTINLLRLSIRGLIWSVNLHATLYFCHHHLLTFGSTHVFVYANSLYMTQTLVVQAHLMIIIAFLSGVSVCTVSKASPTYILHEFFVGVGDVNIHHVRI